MPNDFINQSQLAGAAAVACSELLGSVFMSVNPYVRATPNAMAAMQ
jgi:hypothetical protein